MHLIFIYGPPAAGKLTIAEELRKLTGYKLLENNAINKAVIDVFPIGTRPFDRIVGALRLSIYREAAQHNMDLITTFVYASDMDDGYVKSVIDEVTASGGAVKFVRVTCPTDKLLSRVENKSRMQRGKLMDPDMLKELLSKSDLESRIPFVESLDIDSSKYSPEEAAKLIMGNLAST